MVGGGAAQGPYPQDIPQSPCHPRSKCRHVLCPCARVASDKPLWEAQGLPRSLQRCGLRSLLSPGWLCRILQPPSSSRDRESGGSGKFSGRLARNGEPQHVFEKVKRRERDKNIQFWGMGRAQGKPSSLRSFCLQSFQEGARGCQSDRESDRGVTAGGVRGRTGQSCGEAGPSRTGGSGSLSAAGRAPFDGELDTGRGVCRDYPAEPLAAVTGKKKAAYHTPGNRPSHTARLPCCRKFQVTGRTVGPAYTASPRQIAGGQGGAGPGAARRKTRPPAWF